MVLDSRGGREATYLVEHDSTLLVSDWCEEVALNYLFAGEKENAVAILLTNIAAICFKVHMPIEWPIYIVLNILPIFILIEEKFWIVHLSSKNKWIQGRIAITLSVLLALHLCNSLCVVFWGIRINNLLCWISFVEKLF